jgi:hypothetical protein
LAKRQLAWIAVLLTFTCLAADSAHWRISATCF